MIFAQVEDLRKERNLKVTEGTTVEAAGVAIGSSPWIPLGPDLAEIVNLWNCSTWIATRCCHFNEEQGAQNGAASSKTGSAMPFHGNTCSVHWGGMRQDQQGSEERHRARGRLQLRC